jgi:predicted RNA binding protein YcfA (HicA-like mRNA interferase family)
VTDYVKQLHDLLREAGFDFLRPGKGSHQIWRNPNTGKSVAIPAKVPSRHFANKILKEVGLDKAF